ncbi:MAG: SH3 domain-containing protein [Oscillospiraceae bacterium]|nr:SH3 domain-containing protein [Oscillospiraceae bacterium]
MKKMRIVSGLLAAALLLGTPGVVQTAQAVSADGAVSAATTSSYEVKVTTDSLTIRAKADKTSTIKGYLQKNDVVSIVDESVDSRGYTWGKLANGKGWISLRYTNWSGASDDDTSAVNYKVKVTAGSLTIRAKADKSSTVKGYLQKDAVVTIVEEQDDSRGYTWGKLSNGKGWISLRYTSSVASDGSVSVSYKAKVTASTLNIRAKASSSSSVVGVLKKGKVVTIAAEKDDANGNAWGKLSDGSGWIFLKYTSVTNDSGSFDQYDVKVTAASLYIRAEANQNSEAVGFLRKGNVMTIVAEAKDSSGNTWGKLENGDGWISLKYTTKVSSTPVFAQYKVKVTVNSLRIRASASASSTMTGGLVKGNVVTIVAEKNGWGKLSTGAGWIYLGYTQKV